MLQSEIQKLGAVIELLAIELESVNGGVLTPAANKAYQEGNRIIDKHLLPTTETEEDI